MEFYKETEFHETEIGRIPRDWMIDELGKVSDITSGFGFPIKYQGKQSGKYPFIKVGDMNLAAKYLTAAQNYIDDDDLKPLRAKVFPPETIVFPKIGMSICLNKYRMLKVWATFDNNVAGVIPKEIDAEYLFYYFLWKINLEEHAGRTTAPSIRKTTLEAIKLFFPSRKEQIKIAKILLTVDSLIQQTDYIIQKTQELKKGLMQELLTKGIGHKEFKYSEELGCEIPKEWEVVRIKDITIDHKQGFYTEERYVEDGIKLVRITDLLCPRISYESMPKISLGHKEQEAFKIKKGDFLVARSGAIGRFGIVTEDIPCVFASYIIRFQYDDKRIINDFMGILFQSPIINLQLFQRTQGATNKNINAENIKKIIIPLPSVPEQKTISSILYRIDYQIDKERKIKEELEKLKKALMRLLLTGQVRIKVN
jgi:type I restriction enzyme S subunit